MSQKQESVVGAKVPLQIVDAIFFQGRHGVLLGRVERRHHSLRTDLDLVGVEELEEGEEGSGFHVRKWNFLAVGRPRRVEHGVKNGGSN